ncbi:MAG: DUF1549 domain-containing protein [Planctomycetes bacterium]|nr:DUF1549 domain-containing protein [Planctomycetota bacterium]
MRCLRLRGGGAYNHALNASFRRPLFALLAVVVVTTTAAGQSVSFQRDVLPILSDRCFQCHGPDGNARQSKLRLDTEASALRTDDPVVVPHRSADSKLIAKITATDPGKRMPPADSNLSLSAAEIETLKRWIDEGARWGRHWAFDAPQRLSPPVVADGAWPRNDIDRFVLARLEREGLRPSPEADTAGLLRRVTLDLTGLPPTLEEIDAFLADTSADAYERVVDRLLRSPRYGERMAWEWLDAARYADTDGFQADPTRTMWPWRDWLVNSLNDNLPFDRFTVEALAGDLIPDATPEQVVASGFNRNHMYNGEGGRIAEETRIENVFDRTETTATVWLGLTMTCARCHDHKFDPVTQKEYYRLFAFFDQTSESGAGGQGKAPPTLRYQTAAQRARLAEIGAEVETLTRSMRAPDPEIDGGQRTWEKETLVRLRQSGAELAMITLEDWHLVGPLAPPGGDGSKAFAKEYGPERGVDLARSYEGGKKTWRKAPELVDGGVHAIDDGLGATYLHRVVQAPSARSVDISLGSDDGIQVWLNGAKVFSKNVARGVAADQERTRLDLVKGRNELLLKIVNTGGAAGVYFRKVDETIGGMPGPVVRALLVAAPDRDEAQRTLLLEHHREKTSAKWRASAKKLAGLNAERAAIAKRVATVMVMDTLPANRRRTSRILERGVYDRRLETVKEGTPAFLPPMPAGVRKDRMSLARWLVADDNPLTARVTVNRHWQTFFGRGLVETSENFGQQGAIPSHQRLLDWLARTFVGSGWDVKALHTARVQITKRIPITSCWLADPGSACPRGCSVIRRWRSEGCSTAPSAARR